MVGWLHHGVPVLVRIKCGGDAYVYLPENDQHLGAVVLSGPWPVGIVWISFQDLELSQDP